MWSSTPTACTGCAVSARVRKHTQHNHKGSLLPSLRPHSEQHSRRAQCLRKVAIVPTPITRLPPKRGALGLVGVLTPAPLLLVMSDLSRPPTILRRSGGAWPRPEPCGDAEGQAYGREGSNPSSG